MLAILVTLTHIIPHHFAEKLLTSLGRGIIVSFMTLPTLDAFTRAYLECALWTSDPDAFSGEWYEHDDWTIEHIYPAHIAAAIATCQDF